MGIEEFTTEGLTEPALRGFRTNSLHQHGVAVPQFRSAGMPLQQISRYTSWDWHFPLYQRAGCPPFVRVLLHPPSYVRLPPPSSFLLYPLSLICVCTLDRHCRAAAERENRPSAGPIPRWWPKTGRGGLWLAPTWRAAAEVRRRLLDATLPGCFAPGVMTFEQFAETILQQPRSRSDPSAGS